MVGIAMANYANGKVDCNGRSSAYDGMAYGEVDSGSSGERDMLIIEAGGAEGVYLAEFDIEGLRKYRNREVWGNVYRKPSRYSLLTSREIKEPFVRDYES
jgi:hypothetical protein